jgi:hypothetical protein
MVPTAQLSARKPQYLPAPMKDDWFSRWRKQMLWTDLVIIAGLGIVVTGVALMIYQQLRRGRPWYVSARVTGGVRRSDRLDSMGEIAVQASVFGGIALIQLANVSEWTLPHGLGLSLAACAAMLLVLGVHVGRLLMRWQLGRLHTTTDGESGASAPLA